MSTIISYEWDIESYEFEDGEDGDIIDHYHSDKCPELPTEPGLRLVLVRDVWRSLTTQEVERHQKTFGYPPYSDMTLEDREWAYIEDGRLPQEFDGGSKVPKRFHEEVLKTIGQRK